MLALVATAFPSLTAGECAAGLVGSGFNFGLVERYGEWFDNNSSVSMTHGSHAAFVAEVGFEPNQHWRLWTCETQADCPAAGDPEEKTSPPTVLSTRTTRRVPSKCPPSAASSLARSPRLACACQPEGEGSCPSYQEEVLFRLLRLFRSSLFETKGRTCKRGTVQLARTRDTLRAKQSYTENFHRTSHTAHHPPPG
eukprot:scaffold12242_cov55-Phaeocystis_antarctica.AAC.2